MFYVLFVSILYISFSLFLFFIGLLFFFLGCVSFVGRERERERERDRVRGEVNGGRWLPVALYFTRLGKALASSHPTLWALSGRHVHWWKHSMNQRKICQRPSRNFFLRKASCISVGSVIVISRCRKFYWVHILYNLHYSLFFSQKTRAKTNEN